MAERIHYNAEQFKRRLLDKKSIPDEAVLVKSFAPAIVKDVEDPNSRIVQFVISTGAVDRDGDTIDPNGWDLDSFEKAGSILWGHDSYQPPIAESLAVWVEDNALKAKCRFPTADVYEFSDTIYRLIMANVIKATSVGFRPKSWSETSERPADWGPAVDFMTQELLEYSIVSVPANPEALVEAKNLGINMAPYVKWAEKTLDMMAESGLLTPRNTVERAYFATKATSSVTVPCILKAGRVLSTKNLEKLTKAAEHLNDVISSAKADPDGDDDDDDDDDDVQDPARDPEKNAASLDVVEVDEELATLLEQSEQKASEPFTVDLMRGFIANMVHDALEQARGR